MSGRSNSFYKRKLPHWQPEGASLFLTWRLYGSLPAHAIERLEEARQLLILETRKSNESAASRARRDAKKLFALMDEILDRAEEGPLWLKQPPIADLVVDALLDRYQWLYSLWAFVVMANHVHVLLKPKRLESQAGEAESQSVRLKTITQRLKGYTALEANKLLNRTGEQFWQIETYDHWVRDEVEFYRIIRYIENNPVKAGLVQKPEDWRWSSAWERHRRGWKEIKALT